MCYWVLAEPCYLYAAELGIDLKKMLKRSYEMALKEKRNAWKV
jgi:hypothetical protein